MTTTAFQPKWLTIPEVADLLQFSVSKTKMLVLPRKIRSIKAGHHRRIMPEWVDDYIEKLIRAADGE